MAVYMTGTKEPTVKTLPEAGPPVRITLTGREMSLATGSDHVTLVPLLIPWLTPNGHVRVGGTFCTTTQKVWGFSGDVTVKIVP